MHVKLPASPEECFFSMQVHRDGPVCLCPCFDRWGWGVAWHPPVGAKGSLCFPKASVLDS